MRFHISHYCGALALTLLAGLTLSHPAAASSFGVSLSSRGGAGDACASQPYIDNEGFSSGNLTGSYSVSYSGSAVGYDNSYPYPLPGPEGCQFSPVFANVSAGGTAALGILRASASSSMGDVGLVSAGAGISEGFNDSFFSVTGGTYVFTFSLNAIVTASPACPGGNGNTRVVYAVGTTGFNGETDGDADWSYSECTGNTGPYQTYGNADVISPDEVQITVSASKGSAFGVFASLQLSTGAGENQSASIDASDTATLSITGLDGATYTSASGITYDFSEAPEPASWLMFGVVLAVIALRVRSRVGQQGC